MAICLMKVSEIFEIKGRGLVACLGVSWDLQEEFQIGQTVELRRPDGSRLTTEIQGIEHISPNMHRVTPLLFHLSKRDLPIGTEVWTID